MQHELKSLSDHELIQKLKRLVAEERQLLTSVLYHLKEVETRRLFATEGFASLFEYVVKVLSYSEAQAYRRISAMRVLKELPEIEKAIDQGSINLTHLTLVQDHFKAEKKNGNALSLEEKRTILQSIEGKSTRESEKVLAGLSPERTMKTERVRALTSELTEIKFVASELLIQKLARFKDLDSHVNPNPNYAEVFERLVDLALKQKEKKFSQASAPKENVKDAEFETNNKIKQDHPASARASSYKNHLSKVESSRYIPADLKRAVYARDHGECQYQNPRTRKTCRSKFQTQIDHRVPIARKGESTLENLRILCRQHNIQEGIRYFGVEKMRAS